MDAYGYENSYISNFKIKRELYVKTDNPSYPGTFYIEDGEAKVITRMSEQTKPEQATSDYFYVDVYKDNTLYKVKVGSIKLKRTGKSSGVCNHLNKGYYIFKIKKSNDGCTISSSIEIQY